METNHKEFKPFDKVLVRHHNNSFWNIDFYSHYNNEDRCHETYSTVIRSEDRILPYEGNEGLLGTTDEPDEEVKLETGEWIMVKDGNKFTDPSDFGLAQFLDVSCGRITVGIGRWYYDYAIRFSDFNPNDMEETKKHILCVKNGKIVKYKPE